MKYEKMLETLKANGLHAEAGWLIGLIGQRDELLEALKSAKSRINDILQGDDGQAYKEARKALPRIEAVIAKAEK